MNTKLTSSLVLAGALVALGAPQAQAARPSPGSVLPADAVLVIHADLKALRGTPLFKLYQRELEALLPAKDLARFKSVTGLDPWKDIHTATLGFRGDFSQPNPDFYLVLTGRFPASKIDAAVRKDDGMVVTKRGTLSVYTTKASLGSQPASFAIPDRGHLVLTRQSTLGVLLDTVAGRGDAVSSDAALRPHLQAKGQLLVAMKMPKKLRDEMAANPQASGFADVETVGVALQVDAGLKLLMTEALTSAAAAKTLMGQLQQAVAQLGAMAAQQSPELGRMLGAITVAAKGTSVSVKLALTGQDIKTLRKLAEEGPRGDGPPVERMNRPME